MKILKFCLKFLKTTKDIIFFYDSKSDINLNNFPQYFHFRCTLCLFSSSKINNYFHLSRGLFWIRKHHGLHKYTILMSGRVECQKGPSALSFRFLLLPRAKKEEWIMKISVATETENSRCFPHCIQTNHIQLPQNYNHRNNWTQYSYFWKKN